MASNDILLHLPYDLLLYSIAVHKFIILSLVRVIWDKRRSMSLVLKMMSSQLVSKEASFSDTQLGSVSPTGENKLTGLCSLCKEKKNSF